MSKPGLALSGGGYRAALFHLGALRRLNELGALSRVDTVSSVSGGSIVSAFLASRLQPWPADGERFENFETLVAEPLKKLTSKNIRTAPIVKHLLPWNWLNSQTAVNALADCYSREISRINLPALPQRPDFLYCATDLPFAYADTSPEPIKAWAAKYKSRTNQDPNTAAQYGYVIGDMVAKALEGGGKDLTRAKFVAALEGIRDYKPMFPGPAVSYGPDRRQGTTASFLAKVDGGRWKIVGENLLY